MSSSETIKEWRLGLIDGPLACSVILDECPDQLLEMDHQWITWAFPGDWKSAYSDNLVLSKEELAHLCDDCDQKHIQIRLLERYRDFLDASKHWKMFPDHNWKRITRVIRSMKMQGFDDLASEFYCWCCNSMYLGKDNMIDTLSHWHNAANGG